MTRREMLIEQYEDALFALLMDEVAEAEGEEALRLSEQLRSDPTAEVPELTQKRCERVIRSAFARQGMRRVGRTTGRVLQKVCVAATLCALLFTTAFAAVEDFRVATLNALIEVFDDRTQITFSGVQGGTEKSVQEGTEAQATVYAIQEYGIGLEWLPEDYELKTGWSIPGERGLIFRKHAESELSVVFTEFNEGWGYSFDTEKCTEKPVTVQGHVGTLYTKTEEGLRQSFGNMPQIWSEQTVVWLDHEGQIIGHISALNLTEEEILRLAEGAHATG